MQEHFAFLWSILFYYHYFFYLSNFFLSNISFLSNIFFIYFIYFNYFYVIFLYTNLPCFVKCPRAIVIDWALYKYFYYYYYLSVPYSRNLKWCWRSALKAFEAGKSGSQGRRYRPVRGGKKS